MFHSSLLVELSGCFGEKYNAFLIDLNNDEPDSVVVIVAKKPIDVVDHVSSNSFNSQTSHDFFVKPLKIPLNRIYKPILKSEYIDSDKMKSLLKIDDLVEVNMSKNFFIAQIGEMNGEDLAFIYSQQMDDISRWYSARVKKITSELLSVDIVKDKSTNNAFELPPSDSAAFYSEIVDYTQIRVYSPNQLSTIKKENFFCHIITLSLHSAFKLNLDDLNLIDFIQRIKGHMLVKIVSCNRDNRTFNLEFYSFRQDVIKRICLLENGLRKLFLAKSTYFSSKQNSQVPWGLPTANNEQSGLFSEQFKVENSLMGLCIGSQGRNIIDARELPGVTDIRLDNITKTFYVQGESREAVQQARDRLEIIRDFVQIPTKFVGRVIGSKGVMLQEIVDKTQIMRVYVVGGQEGDMMDVPHIPDHTVFQIEGRRSHVEDARLMLEFNIEVLKQTQSNSSHLDYNLNQSISADFEQSRHNNDSRYHNNNENYSYRNDHRGGGAGGNRGISNRLGSKSISNGGSQVSVENVGNRRMNGRGGNRGNSRNFHKGNNSNSMPRPPKSNSAPIE